MTLYAGKLLLRPAACRRLKIRDCYSLHRVVEDLFSQSDLPYAPGAHNGVLWVDGGERLEGHEVRILSNRMPTCTDLPDDVRFACAEIPEAFFEAPAYRFAITVNPTCMRAGKRVALTTPAEICAWFNRKTSEAGMQVTVHKIEHMKKVSFDKDGHQVTFFQARLIGELQVTDQVLFRQCVEAGIGRSKAFGCGLLQLAK